MKAFRNAIGKDYVVTFPSQTASSMIVAVNFGLALFPGAVSRREMTCFSCHQPAQPGHLEPYLELPLFAALFCCS
jgi:hypothetical protein